MSTAVETPALPGWGPHSKVPYYDYSRWPAVNHSVLRHFNRTPAHARAAIVDPADQSEAQALGHATHVAILEPDRFDLEYVPSPRFDKRTNAGKAGWAEFKEANVGKVVLPQEEFDACLAMRDGVWAHQTAAELLKGPGYNELSALWRDAETGVPCKARLDRLTTLAEWPVIVDLKTTKDAGRRSFERDVHFFRYHQQAAFYLDGLFTMRPHQRKFMFIAVEKDPPYLTAVYELEDVAIEQGRDEYRKHLAQYADCIRTGVWPGYPQGCDYVSLPAWAFKVWEG